MKLLITENQKERIALNWMNKNFSPEQLEIVKNPDYSNRILYEKNDKVVMEQNLKNKDFWFDYKEIWSFFQQVFSMEYEEIQSLLNTWLEDTLNLKGYTSMCMYFRYRFSWKRLSN